MQDGAKRRVQLSNKDPHCYWCGVLTVDRNGGSMQNNTATIDHLWAVGTVERQTDSSVVLACNRCNLERGAIHSTRIQLRKRLANFKLMPNPEEVRKVRIEQGFPVQNFILEAKTMPKLKEEVLPQQEMKPAIAVAAEANNAGVIINNQELPFVTLTKDKPMKKQYYHIAVFGIGCAALGAGFYVVGIVALLIAAQALIKE